MCAARHLIFPIMFGCLFAAQTLQAAPYSASADFADELSKAVGESSPHVFFPNGDIGAPLHIPAAKKAPAPAPPVKSAQAKPVQTASVTTVATQPVQVTPPATATAPIAELDEAQIQAEIDRLRLLFQKEVPAAFTPSSSQKDTWLILARQQASLSGYVVQTPQAVVIADRNPTVQRACIVVARPNTPEWTIIGCTRISTGTIGRKHHYITPVGIFTNTADRLGYRAQGTKNENGIMGNGTKGMRVWDFGWQVAEKGWLPSREQGPIRLEMHATDPVFLERQLGHMASAGCIRIPAALNIYIDKNGLLDAEYERKAATDKRFRALLRTDRTPSQLAGMAVIVVDSAPPPNVTAQHNPSPNLVSARIPNSPIH